MARVSSDASRESKPKRAHLDSLGIHLVPLLGLGPVESGVTLLGDEEIGEVDLLELELDGLDEFGRDVLSCFGTC
jgi:hypothetical protein